MESVTAYDAVLRIRLSVDVLSVSYVTNSVGINARRLGLVELDSDALFIVRLFIDLDMNVV